jgi:hypothetical protein
MNNIQIQNTVQRWGGGYCFAFYSVTSTFVLHYYHYVVGFIHSNRVHVHLHASGAQLAQDREVEVELRTVRFGCLTEVGPRGTRRVLESGVPHRHTL